MAGSLIVPLFCIWWVLYDLAQAQKRIAAALEALAPPAAPVEPHQGDR